MDAFDRRKSESEVGEAFYGAVSELKRTPI